MIVPITSLSDPRIAPYRNLKDRDLAREGGRFLAEGHLLVQRLLASGFATESVLMSEARVADRLPQIPDHVPTFVAPPELMSQIVGFKFHQGVMAVGLRGDSPTVDEVMEKALSESQALSRERQVTWLIAPDIEKSDNLGAIIRIAAGFGAVGVLLGERSCDPFHRQSVRVSMGAVFSLPVVRSHDLLADLRRLREEHGVELVATVLADGAESLESAGRAERLGILLGNEFHGLAPEVVALCDRKVTLPMELETDSLNVAVAAGVFLYHFTRVARADG